MNNAIRRRMFLMGAAGLASAAALPTMAGAQGMDLVVGTWGGTFGDLVKANVDEQIMRPAGYDVVQEISGPVPRRTKLITQRMNRRGSMDVALLADFDMYAAAAVGALEKLDESNVPNFRNILPFLKHDHSVPMSYSAHVIVYRKDLIPIPPQSIAELWNPAYKGKIGLSDFLYTTNMAYAAVANGGNAQNYEGAEKGVQGWRDLEAKLLPSTEAVGQALATGDIWLTIIAAARGYNWMKEGVDLGWVVPEEGAFPAVYEGAVPTNARNKDGGIAYMNALLEPRAQAGFAEKMGYLPTVSNGIIDPDLQKLIGFTDEEQQRLWVPDMQFIMDHQASMLDSWNRIFKG